MLPDLVIDQNGASYFSPETLTTLSLANQNQ